MEHLYHIFCACLRLQFLDVETNPSLQHPVPDVCRILISNVRGLTGNLSDLTVELSRNDILLCSETLVSDMHRVSELLVPRFGYPVLWCRGKMHRARGMTAYIWDGYGAFCQPKFECGSCEMIFRVCGVRQNLYVLSLFINPDQDDQIFYCILISMAAMQAEDVHASFLFVGDLNGNHQQWLGSPTTNRHGVAAFDLTLSGCDQLVVGLTHARGRTLDPQMTDTPDLA